MRNRKLLVIHPAIAPYRVDFFNSLSEEFDAYFFFEFENALEQNFNQENLISRLRFKPRYLNPGVLGIKNLRLSIFSIIKEIKPEIVIISEYNLLGILVVLYKFLFSRNIKIVSICDDYLVTLDTISLGKKLLRRFLLHNIDMVILPNDNIKEWYEKKFPYKAKYCYFPIIQNDDVFRQNLVKAIPKTINLIEYYGLDGKNVLLYVGRLVGIKNVSLLLDSFSSLFHKYDSWRLMIVGEGEQYDVLKEKSRRLGLSDFVYFVGKKEGDDLMACYNIGDIFVLPSVFERFGSVVNEALLSGCYTICSSAAGASCLIFDDNGYVFQSGNLDDLTYALNKAMMEHQDRRSLIRPNYMKYKYEEYLHNLLEELNF